MYQSESAPKKDTPYLALTGKLWGAFCELFGEIWPHYNGVNGTTLYMLMFLQKMAQYKGAAKEAGRALILAKKRQKEQQDLELRKRKIEEELKLGNINNKFAAHYDAVEQKLKSDTIGRENHEVWL